MLEQIIIRKPFLKKTYGCTIIKGARILFNYEK